jgi:tetratricopeptide (TPR) repeat protein
VDVAFRLVRREVPAAADAVLLFADGFGPLAAACARIGGELPAVYPVSGGFLVVPRTAAVIPGAVRLRRLAADLYIPADADLVPTLLPDESVGLTHDHGLIFLPGGEVLAFDPTCPLAVGEWLRPVDVRREQWKPFPPRPERAESLHVIERPAPPAAVIEVLAAGAPDDVDPLPGSGAAAAGAVPDDARPLSAPLGRRIAAAAGLGVAGFLAWLGRALRAPGLARRGADLARRALERVPRLTERLLGQQEAALREVLRQLQSGDVEKGLRRAPVAVPDPDAPARVGTTADLDRRDPRYDLRDLIGRGSGPGVAWLGGGDVWAELAAEYRRLAREAQARGDHRRAAYLYGVLLGDPRSAANALMAGGLFRDAAVIFRDRVHDPQAAATAFDRAGDYDEAVRLYDRLDRWEAAGELLRRIGDDERALTYFTKAADALAAAGHWLSAGDLLRTKASRDDVAVGYYRRGWEADRADAVVCGNRLADRHLLASEWDAAEDLFDEAETRFAPPRAADAGRFFNTARKAAKGFLPPDRYDDLLDRARLLFARHTPAGRGTGTAEELFVRPADWPGPVVRDALHAARKTGPRPAAEEHPPPVKLADGFVTAVAAARDSAAVVVATTSAVVCWRPDVGVVVPVCPSGGRIVVSVAADPTANVVYLLQENGEDLLLRCYRSGDPRPFEPGGQVGFSEVAGRPGWQILPFVDDGPEGPVVTVVGQIGCYQYHGLYLQPTSFDAGIGETTHLVADAGDGGWWQWVGRMVALRPTPIAADLVRWTVPWLPGRPIGTSLANCPVDWLIPARSVLEVCGLVAEGTLYWSRFDALDPDAPTTRTRTRTHPDRFLAACLVTPGVVAAATGRNEVLWYRESGDGLLPHGPPIRLGVPARAVALVAPARSGRLIVVLEDGSAVQLFRP